MRMTVVSVCAMETRNGRTPNAYFLRMCILMFDLLYSIYGLLHVNNTATNNTVEPPNKGHLEISHFILC